MYVRSMYAYVCRLCVDGKDDELSGSGSGSGCAFRVQLVLVSPRQTRDRIRGIDTLSRIGPRGSDELQCSLSC
jgi:hypothetical protein